MSPGVSLAQADVLLGKARHVTFGLGHDHLRDVRPGHPRIVTPAPGPCGVIAMDFGKNHGAVALLVTSGSGSDPHFVIATGPAGRIGVWQRGLS